MMKSTHGSELAVLQEQIDSLQDTNSNLESDIVALEKSNADLNNSLKDSKPRYFRNLTEIESWLDSVPHLGVSRDVDEWYQYALFYQKNALDAGYIVSVGNWEDDDSITVWCEIVTEDGWVYFFDPDDLELVNQYIQVDTSNIENIDLPNY
jgi:hypothetical protein